MLKDPYIKNPKPYKRPEGNIHTMGMPLFEWEFYQRGGTREEFAIAMKESIEMIYGKTKVN